jgi:hypothetical protein
MQIGQLITRQDKIIVGKQQLFIAKKDFSFFGIPILKDSMVYYNGLGELRVNLILLGIFAEPYVPKLVEKKLRADDNFYYVDKVSDCPLESNELDKGSWGVWHTDHFDCWNGSFEPFLDRIAGLPVLEYKGICFSALMYNYNISRQTLDWFITADTSRLMTDDAAIEFPAGLEVSKYPTLNCYDIVPIAGNTVYKNIELDGLLYAGPDGVVSGITARDIVFTNNHNGISTRTEIPKGIKVNITPSGEVKIAAPMKMPANL